MRSKTLLSVSVLAASVASLLLAGCANTQHTGSHGANGSHAPITKAEVMAAQKEWGDGIVDISRVYTETGDAKARATEHIKTLYAYGNTIVLFKPTLASEDQFRGDFDGALSYFIGREGTEDTGFAIKGWTNVRFECEGIHTGSELAMAMGNYFFTDPSGSETKVEYSFGYVRGADGKLQIMLQHSSVPYGSWK